MYLSYLNKIDKREFDHSYRSWEKYLNIIEGKCSEEELSGSLLNLVHIIRWDYRHDGLCKRPMIFIDEVSRPLLYAAEYGFEDKLRRFYDTFLDIDHYELTGGIYTTSYAPINTDVSFNLKYIGDKPVNAIPVLLDFGKERGLKLQEGVQRSLFWPFRGYFERKVNLKACFHEMELDRTITRGKCNLNISIDNDTLVFISQKREWIEQSRIEEEKATQRKKEAERKEYAAPLAEWCDIPSKFAGIRNLNLEIANEDRHIELNSVLRALYIKFGKEVKGHEVYDFIQNIDKSGSRIKGISKLLEELQQEADNNRNVYSCKTDFHDQYWGRFDLSRSQSEPGYSDMALIKVYISVSDDSSILPVFGDVIKHLIKHGKHRFHAKVARYKRNDHICIWIAREDFFDLEKYIEKYNTILIKPLPFIAYRNKLGISREFYSWDSHNGVQASMICLYLNHIDNIDDIEVLTMYSQYVKAWNGELPEEHYLTQEYKRSNAQELLILIETLNVLLENSSITDDHPLLNGDDDLWCALGESKNWHQVGQKLARILNNKKHKGSKCG